MAEADLKVLVKAKDLAIHSFKLTSMGWIWTGKR